MENMTCYEMLIKNCNYKKGAIIFNKHRITMEKFIKDIDAFAESLHNLGFKKGDVLTIYLPTCPQSLVGFYACSKLGIIANIVHPLFPLDQLKDNLIKTKSKGLMFYDILIKDHKELICLNQILISCSIANYVFFRKGIYYLYTKIKSKACKRTLKYSKLIMQKPIYNITKKKILPIKGKSEDVVCTMHSGGTSGQPKIVCLTNKALNNLSVSLEQMYTRKNRGNEYGLVALPMFHAYGLGVSVHTCLTNKYSLILVPKFLPKEINKLIKYHNVTFMAGVPIMFKKMLEQKNFRGSYLSKLRDLWCGGDVLNESFVEYFDTILEHYNAPARLMRGYGLTEVSSVCAVNTFENYKKFSCGKAIPNTTIEIWDENEKKLKANSIGEVVVNSSSVMKGYLDGDGFVQKNDKIWIKTGDLGYLDEEGFLFILDRKKRSIKISAVNIFPSEIEDVAKNHPDVDEACAVAYHYKEKVYIKLYVTLKDDQLNKEKIKREIFALCEKKLIKYSWPRLIEIIDEMPRTNFGKVDYKKFEMLR